MNTTAAALEARVTVATIRAWCRAGVVAAVKRAGRWIIEAASLARRITIGQRKATMTTQPKYRIEQGTETAYGQERATFTIVRTDGTPAGYQGDHRISGATYNTLETAEAYAAFYENTPDDYRITRRLHPARSMKSGPYWRLEGGMEGDSHPLCFDQDSDRLTRDLVDMFIAMVKTHAESAPARIAAAAEKAAVAAAEAAVREAREQQLEDARRQKGALATPKQIDYILQLLEQRERTGEGGGFFTGPTDRAGLETLSRREASTYITSLKVDY